LGIRILKEESNRERYDNSVYDVLAFADELFNLDSMQGQNLEYVLEAIAMVIAGTDTGISEAEALTQLRTEMYADR